jgi:hypothetical protein
MTIYLLYGGWELGMFKWPQVSYQKAKNNIVNSFPLLTSKKMNDAISNGTDFFLNWLYFLRIRGILFLVFFCFIKFNMLHLNNYN